jgi:hypothetical protein
MTSSTFSFHIFSPLSRLYSVYRECYLLRCYATSKTHTYCRDMLAVFFFLMADCLACSSILRMEAVYSSETFINFYQITRRHIPDESKLHSHWRENQKFNTVHICTSISNNSIQFNSIQFVFIYMPT